MVSNPFTLEGKTILVTGASSGIGKSTAIECAKIGAQVIITARNEERLNETLKMIGDSPHKLLIADLTNPTDVDRLISNLPLLDGIVHSAGISKRVPLKFIKEESLSNIHKINFIAPAMLSQKLIKNKLLKNNSSIVFISSVASSYATVGSIMYMTTKGALNSLVKGLANELAADKIRVNAIQPGMIYTKMANAVSEDDIAKDLANYPLGRYGTPEEVAYAAIYLLSDASAWVTGTLLTIDGGLTLR